MNNDRLIFHERAVSFIIAPDTLRSGIRRRPSKHAAEHLQGAVDPALLVNRSRSVAFDARNEQDDENTLATAAEKRSLADRRGAPLHHYRSI